jgi:hypothetical protein
MRDYDIRKLLKKTKLSTFMNDPHSKVVEELGINSAGARIDIAVINGSFHGFEIKSERDTLQRLPYQLEAYTKVFDYVSVVTETKHVDGILDILPDWVGVYLCSGKSRQATITEYRAPIQNISLDGFYLAKLLWREELLSILSERKIYHLKKYRNWILCEILAKELEIKELSEIVRVKLKQRTDWKNNF